MSKYLVVLCFIVSLFQTSMAQEAGISIPDSLRSPIVFRDANQTSVRKAFSLPFGQSDAPENFNATYKRVEYKNRFPVVGFDDPKINFMPEGRYTYAGDINGDGKDDFVLSFTGETLNGRGNIADERTEDLSDFVSKSLVFFGNSPTNAHDQLFYDEINPVGDLNGDGFEDGLGRNLDNTLSYYMGSVQGFVKETEIFADTLSESIAGFRDFNGDGYADIISYSNTRSMQDVFHIIYGGATVDDFVGRTYSVPNGIYLLPARLSQDVIVQLSIPRSTSMEVTVLKIKPEDLTLEVSEAVSLDMGFLVDYEKSSLFRAIDTDGDGLEEIYVPWLFAGGLDLGLILHASESGYEELTTFFADPDTRWEPAGDIDGDGRTDFMGYANNGVRVAYGPTDFSNGINSLEPILPLADFNRNVPNAFGLPSDSRYYRLGDVNGDGIDDFSVSIVSDEEFGQRIYFGSLTRELNAYQDNLYQENDFNSIPNHHDSANLDDINNDGYDDLALSFSDGVKIFYGGSFKEEPDLIIPTRGTGNNNLETGDFNGDGINDLIVVSYVETDAVEVRSGIEFRADVFLSGEGFGEMPALTLDRMSVGGEGVRGGAYDITNLGDFNNDGYDDFALTFFGLGELLIYYGGESLSSSPDLILQDFNSDFGIEGLSSNAFTIGYRLLGLGDINGDGIEDFAVSDSFREYRVDNVRFSRGAVFIFYGSKHEPGEVISRQPDDVLILSKPELKDLDEFGFRLAAGDFNGDGRIDLLASAEDDLPIRDPNFPTDSRDNFFIYHGGPDFDTEFDQIFGLPGEAFGNQEFGQVSGGFNEVTKVNDLNGDGADEIFIGSYYPHYLFPHTNGILIMGGEAIDEQQIPAIQFVAPNQSEELSAYGNFINIEYKSAVGDFDGDGIIELVVHQGTDRNYRQRPVYVFPIQNPYKEEQTIEFDPEEQLTYTTSAIDLAATASSGLDVSFKVLSGPATVTENRLVLTGTGTVVIEASQAGNAVYNPAPLVRRSVIVTKAEQTITFGEVGNKTFGDDPFEIEASADSGLDVELTVQSGPGSLDGNELTITGVGDIVIVASQAGNDNYNETSRALTISVAKAEQTITFGEVGNKTFGDDPFEIEASADSGLDVELTVQSGPGSLAGNELTITGAGDIVLAASQAGNDNYNAATGELTISVAKAEQTITFGEVGNKTFGDDPFEIEASADSGLDVELTVQSGPGSLAGNELTITGAGDIVLAASQAGNDNYNAATGELTISVAKAEQTITFGEVGNKTFGDDPFEIEASADSGLDVELTVQSGPGSLDGKELTITGAGDIVVAALQAGNDNYNAATGELTISVAKAEQTITFDALQDKSVEDTPFELNATSSSGLDVTYEVVNGPASVSGSTVSLDGMTGKVEIRAIQAGNDNYNSAASVMQSFEVTLVTSLEVAAMRQDVRIYPNPFLNQLSLELKRVSLHRFKQIEILNSSGRVVRIYTVSIDLNETITLELPELSAGLYFVQITAEDGVLIQKVIKRH